MNSQRLDDCRGSRRTRSIIMYGRNELSSSQPVFLDQYKNNKNSIQNNVCRVSNTVQAQIERMFTDVIKDATACSFPVTYLGSLILQQKITSLQGLQDPLRQLYLNKNKKESRVSGQLDICSSIGLKIKTASDTEANVTPFHNIAVWSAVKFVVSPMDGGAAFLPLITDPENIDKKSLFRPLTSADQQRLSSELHAPIFAVVMRSPGIPKLLECHGFVCQTPEDAIVIAATLYQSLMAHVSTDSNHVAKQRTPRNQNGVSCISISSSSALIGISSKSSIGRKTSLNRRNELHCIPTKTTRKKRAVSNSQSSIEQNTNFLSEDPKTITKEGKKKSYKTKRAPQIPSSVKSKKANFNDIIESSISYLEKQSRAKNSLCLTTESICNGNDGTNGDILTRVAIPRSGSFLNTSGLTRYKSRTSKRNCGKIGGGGGSPLGFSELFNEFRLHENLHSLDEILNVIIDADGMSFNDLKPIYKEFLLKLAVTLTKDELYQRSKNIMRRQRKKKLKRQSHVKKTSIILSAKGLKNVFWLGHFQPCKFKKLLKCTKNKQGLFKSVRKRQQYGGRNGTSESEVSDLHNENMLNGINRNCSSGYVSCSECSFDSEDCTCTSADRCYCSLRGKPGKARAEGMKSSKNLGSLTTCKTQDKCYCSIDDTTGDISETTLCDSNSCVSSNKCYCKTQIKERQKLSRWCEENIEKLGLDYELFTIGCSGKTVKPHEALSAKKSAEAAATFADLKVVQTTDIKSFEAFSSRKNKSLSADSLLTKVDAILESKMNRNSDSSYQSIKILSSSLEDSLGYLP